MNDGAGIIVSSRTLSSGYALCGVDAPMTTNIERDVRFLKRYAVGTSTLLVLLSIAGFTRSAHHAKFDEIDVERINIREPNGNYRMVISNRLRWEPRHRRFGIRPRRGRHLRHGRGA
jgi:hypothetical protein